MKLEEVKVGTTYHFRTWDDMEKEFGLDKDGDITNGNSFVDEMKYLCGQDFTPTSVENDICSDCLLPEAGGWVVSAWMIEPIV